VVSHSFTVVTRTVLGFPPIGAGTGKGCRLIAGLSAVLCLAGGIILSFFNEKKIAAGLKKE
jgi:hypothetical protein